MTTPHTRGAADLPEMVSKALREAYNLGQRYWQQADSEYISQHKKADDTRAKFLALVEETCAALAAGRATAPQQAAPKAAPGEPSDYQIRAITTAYEQGVGKGHQAYKSGKEITNPYDSAYGCDLAWHYGYGEGKEQAQRATKAAPQQGAQEPVAWLNPWRADQVTTDYDAYGERGIPLYTAPQPAPAPLSEMPYEKRKAIQEGEQISASDAWFKARHEMLDTVDRRNVFRAGFDRGWSAALAAQGGK